MFVWFILHKCTLCFWIRLPFLFSCIWILNCPLPSLIWSITVEHLRNPSAVCNFLICLQNLFKWNAYIDQPFSLRFHNPVIIKFINYMTDISEIFLEMKKIDNKQDFFPTDCDFHDIIVFLFYDSDSLSGAKIVCKWERTKSAVRENVFCMTCRFYPVKTRIFVSSYLAVTMETVKWIRREWIISCTIHYVLEMCDFGLLGWGWLDNSDWNFSFGV